MAFSSVFSRTVLPVSFLDLVRASNDRKVASLKRQRFYHDQQADDTLAILNQRFRQKSRDGWSIPTVNLVKKIVNKRAAVYVKAPRRTFEGWNQAAGDALYEAVNADVLLKKASRLTKLHKTALLQVFWKNGPRACVLTPDILDATAPDPEQPDRIIVTRKNKNAVGKVDSSLVTYSDWTVTGWALRDQRGVPFRTEGNPDQVNPYGVLPFVNLFDYSPDADFFLAGGDDLCAAQESVNITLANLLKNLESQSHGFPWIASGEAKGSRLHPQGSLEIVSPTRALMLPKDGRFGFAKPEIPIDEVLKAIEFVLKETAVANDLPASVFSIEDDGPESGKARLIESTALVEAREDDLGLWRRYEDQFFELLKIVVNTHAPGTIPTDAKLSVDFAEIVPVVTEAEKLQAHQQKLDLGVWSAVDVLMNDNPDITDRAVAMKVLQSRQEESALLGTLFAGPPINTGET